VLFILDALEQCDDDTLERVGNELVKALERLGEDVRVERPLLRRERECGMEDT
jgi:hypothetical protein